MRRNGVVEILHMLGFYCRHLQRIGLRAMTIIIESARQPKTGRVLSQVVASGGASSVPPPAPSATWFSLVDRCAFSLAVIGSYRPSSVNRSHGIGTAFLAPYGMMAMFLAGLFRAIAAFRAAFAALFRAFFCSFLDSFEFLPSAKNCFVSSLKRRKVNEIRLSVTAGTAFDAFDAGRRHQ